MNIKLTRDQANEALGRLEYGETERAVASRLGVTQSCIHLIKIGKSWIDLPPFQKPLASTHSKRCGRCDQPGHHKGTCSTLLTAAEETSIAEARKQTADRKQYAARRDEQIEAATSWKKQHPEKVKEYSRTCWERNKERFTKERQEARRVAYAKTPKETWLKETFRHARRRAKRAGIPYDKEIPDLELPDYCSVLGIALDYSGFRGKADIDSPSLDRIVPSRGYVKANLRVISLRANRLKNNASFSEIRQVYLDMEHLAKKGNSGMRKRDEMEHPESCFNKARSNEHLFVLLARDLAAPAVIRAWVAERIRIGKNMPNDLQIREALDCAALMEVERAEMESTRRQQEMRWTEDGDVL